MDNFPGWSSPNRARPVRAKPNRSSITVKISARALSSVVWPSPRLGMVKIACCSIPVSSVKAFTWSSFSSGKWFRIFGSSARRELDPGSCHAVGTNPRKAFHVTLRCFFPDHIAREQIGALPHGMAFSQESSAVR